MRRVIDCTYLSAVARALQGEATHLDDVATLLRFVAEILIADQVLFTADPAGPVYRPAMRAAQAVFDCTGDPSFLRHFTADAVDYTHACRAAAADLASDLKFIPSGGLSTGSVYPEFSGDNRNPDVNIFVEARDSVRAGKPLSPLAYAKPATGMRFILTQPAVVDGLRRSGALETITDEDDCLRLTAVVRMFIYRHLARQLQGVYLPGSSRAKLLPTRDWRPSIQPAQAGVHPAHSPLSLAAAVDALVRLSSGDPRDLLRRAWLHRKVIFPLRELLDPAPQRDAIGTSFKTALDARRLGKELADVLGGNPDPSLADCLEIQLVVFAIPMLRVHLKQFREWRRRRRAVARVGEFANLMLQAEHLDSISAYESLIRRAGLRKEAS
jgi:hypothetical protein